jgi:hypothetical protein
MPRIAVENLTDHLDKIIDQLDDVLTFASDDVTLHEVVANEASFEVIRDNVASILEAIKDSKEQS